MWFTLVFDIRSNEMKCLSIEHISHIVKRTKAFSIDCFYRLSLLCFAGFLVTLRLVFIWLIIHISIGTFLICAGILQFVIGLKFPLVYLENTQ